MKKSIAAILELLTAAVLLLVLGVIGWIVLAALWPAAVPLATTSTEVGLVIGLLLAALGLVSAVALIHTA